jgi:hypothetical protein
MRGIEIEVPDQSDVLLFSIVKEQIKKNKSSVQSIIDSISSPSFTYFSIVVSFRSSQSNETLIMINQTPYSLFSLFFSFDLCEIVIKNINLKANKKYFRNSKEQRHWHDTCASEIEAFLEILLYMRLALMSRIIDY